MIDSIEFGVKGRENTAKQDSNNEWGKKRRECGGDKHRDST